MPREMSASPVNASRAAATTPAVHVLAAPAPGQELIDLVARLLPEGDFRRICLKPNWVKHEEDARFPIRALVTSPALIEAVIEACLRKYPRAESVVIGDVPLQSADWDRMTAQSGLDALVRKYASGRRPVVRFGDWRRERFVEEDGFLARRTAPGDPAGYREVILDESSFVESISADGDKFRVSDFDPVETVSSHRRGRHRYVICGSVLDSDLFINLPKMKTHQKAGVTGALKNLVGINGDKACLVHHRMGVDEFAPGAPWLVRCQVRLRGRWQKRSPQLFRVGRRAWEFLKRLRRIETAGTLEALAGNRLYVASGSWHGNDTLWRMIYDLNRIIRYAPPQGGHLAATPQRAYVAIMDGVVSGEGNGPLQPLPVESGLILASDDPFLVDMAMARLMGFDYRAIPCLCRHRSFADARWGCFNPADVCVIVDGRAIGGLDCLAPIRPYVPPPGWRGHMEMKG